MTRKALGRGLGALIPGAPEPGSSGIAGAALGDPQAPAEDTTREAEPTAGPGAPASPIAHSAAGAATG